MRTLGKRYGLSLSVALAMVALPCAWVQAAEIKQLLIETSATGTRAEVRMDKASSYKLIPLSNPERLAVDFPESELARGVAMPAAVGVVKAVRTGHPVAGTVRVVFDLANKVKAIPTEIETLATGYTLVLEWPGDGHGRASAVPSQQQTSQSVVPAASAADPLLALVERAESIEVPAVAAPMAEPEVLVELPKIDMRAGVRPLVVAIDAGHGGQDPGAHGKNGAREKDITLAIARELARQVNATPGLKAFLTRESDMFIPLEHRARKASANKADIFLSIHADAAENRSARGSSVYILSTRGASSQRARWLADKENAADVIGGGRVRASDNTLTNVLLDLTQSGNMKASEDAASHVLGGLKRVGNNHKPDIERANFAVLRTSDKMPAMLVETAFISNPDEEKRLIDPEFQKTLARAILDGVDRYFARQPPPGTLYAVRAQAANATASGGKAAVVGGSR